jgi:tetratricopeptide (TPR) repeat protein
MLRFIILSISILTMVSNYMIFNSYRYQTILLNDAKNDMFTLSSSQLKNIYYKYPSLALNSVPILTYISRYYSEENNFNDAIDQLKQSLVFNPNSLYTKYLLSRNYIFLNDFKSAEIYLEEIFHESPKIESSTSLYFFILGENKNISKLIEYRNMLADIDNYKIWSFYIAAIKKNISDNDDAIFYDSLVADFENKF